jgi:hypothetical protein
LFGPGMISAADFAIDTIFRFDTRDESSMQSGGRGGMIRDVMELEKLGLISASRTYSICASAA